MHRWQVVQKREREMSKLAEPHDVAESYRCGSQGHQEAGCAPPQTTNPGGEIWALRWSAHDAPQVPHTTDRRTCTERATAPSGRPTLATVYSTRFFINALLEDLRQLVSLHQRKPRTLQQYSSLARTYLAPLADRPISDLTVTEVREWHRRCAVLAASSAAPNTTTGTTTANRALMLLTLVFQRAEEDGALPIGSSPTQYVHRFREKARARYLSPAELAEIWSSIERCERRRVRRATPFDRPYVHSVTQAIRLILLLALRREEGLSLRWCDVSFEAGRELLRLPDAKSGTREVPLSRLAVRVLRQQQARGTSPWVFPGRGGRAPIRDRVWREILEDCSFDSSEVVLHTARHSLATLELQEGSAVEHVMSVLGHSTPSVTLNVYGRRLATKGARKAVERHSLRMRRRPAPTRRAA